MTMWHGAGSEITEIDRPIWLTDDADIAAEYSDIIVAVEVDELHLAETGDLPCASEVCSLEDWKGYATEILAAGYDGLRIDGDMTQCGTVHSSILVVNPRKVRVL